MTAHVACAVNEVAGGRGKAVEVGGRRLSIFRVGDAFHAIDDACTHLGASMGEGIVVDGCAVCPWHGAQFDLVTGAAFGPPARGPVQAYRCRVDGSDVLVEL